MSRRPARRRRALRARSTGPLGLYVPGASWIHRMGPGCKLAVLACVSVLLAVAARPGVALAALAGVVLAGVVAQIPLRAVARPLLPIVVAAVALGGYQWWARDWQSALVTSAGLLAVVAGATLVTATTSSDRLLDAMTSAAGPLRLVGVRPQTFALAVTLVLRTVAVLLDLAWDVGDAARARGLEHSPRALLVPFVLRSVARAHTTADALTARGLLEDDPGGDNAPEAGAPPTG